MQKLVFQSAWDSTIADQDRIRIEQTFREIILSTDKMVQFTSLWQAKNHRGDLLVAVIIHNTSQQDFSITDEKMTYSIQGVKFAEHTFSPPITVEKQTSMPWTFIFPAGSFNSTENFHGGVLDSIS
ncbi:SLAP domain-containing protein [Virgibacillus sp. C22-A2]|uniref:SLAP domain-containing protein n=1 Tax=Virgibacillus tibetensis TaxID=3042313 RepID=A0ABU6KDW9_9BACI|nr:SLAP domain-containing protein [Virgibacillus sp. C22-A2]